MRLLRIVAWVSAAAAFKAPSRRAAPATVRGLHPVVNTPAAWAVGSVVGGTLGVPVVSRAIKSWYSDGTLKLPEWTPPDRVFAPIWTALYASLGVSAGLVAQVAGAGSPAVRMAGAHYALNLLWAPVFFGLKLLRVGAAINVALLASLLPIGKAFFAASPRAAGLLVPYAAWLAFATALNVEICRLNPDFTVVTLKDAKTTAWNRLTKKAEDAKTAVKDYKGPDLESDAADDFD